MTEDFNNLLSVNHFFNEAVNSTQGFLLFHEIGAALSGDFLDGLENHYHGNQHKQGQPEAEVQHGTEDSQNGDTGREHLRHTLGNHLAKGIGIVGVVAHDVAVGMGIEVTDGKLLHLGEHGIADVLQCSLCNDSHHPVVNQRSHNTGGKDEAHGGNDFQQFGEVEALVQQHGGDEIIDQCLNEQSGGNGSAGTDENTDHNENQLNPICAQIGEKAADGSGLETSDVFGHCRRSVFLLRFIHPERLLCSENSRLPDRSCRTGAALRGCRRLPVCRRPSPESGLHPVRKRHAER